MAVLVRRTKLPVGVCRGILEGLAVLVGWLLGGRSESQTIAAAFGISLCVQLVFSMLKFDSTSVNMRISMKPSAIPRSFQES